MDAGGIAKIYGTTTFAKKVPGTLGSNVYMTGETSVLAIENGGTLDADGAFVSVAGGKLATMAQPAVQGTRQPDAEIKGTLAVDGAAPIEVKISDVAYNPAGTTGHQYATLKVLGDIIWAAGTYRPVVKEADPLQGDIWEATGTFFVGADNVQGTGAKIAPEPGTVVNKNYLVMKAGAGKGFQKYQVAGTLPNVVNPWLMSVNSVFGVNVTEWKVNKLG